jgi:tetratricopeptide (TPR) repeat protein
MEAQHQARAADDGPLLARAWLERAAAEGATALAIDAPSAAASRLVVAALDTAGTSQRQSALRASARFRLAWEFAAEGDERGALMELDAAAIEAERAGKPPSQFYDDGWPALRSGATLRRLGRYVEAEATLTRALSGPPIRTTAALSDLARVHAARGDADAAAAALEEAFLLVRAHGIAGRQYRILATREVLPECPAVRQLDAVMDGG